MRTDESHSFQSSIVTCTCELPCVVMLNCDGCFFAVRIGSMLGYTPMDEDSLSLLLSHIQDFLK